MRNLITTIIFCTIFCMNLTFSQLTLHPNGNIGINNEVPEWDLDITGKIRLKNQSSSSAVIMDKESHSALIFGAGNNAGLTFDEQYDFEFRSTNRAAILNGSVSSGDILFFLKGATGNVGIGTNTPNQKLTVKGNLLLQHTSNNNSLIQLTSTSLILNKSVASANALIDINPRPENGTSNASVRLFRSTNTTGLVKFDIHTGKNSGDVNTRLSGFGDSFLNKESGNVGIGTSTPAEKLDIGGSVLLPNNSYYKCYGTNGTAKHESLGMDSNGNLVINRTGITQNLESGVVIATADRFIDMRDKNNSSLLRIDGNTGFVGIGTPSANEALTLAFGTATKPGGGDWAATSDRRSKKNIREFEDGLEQVLKIQPVTYQYNGRFGTNDDGKHHIGVVAQEIQKIAPYTVFNNVHKIFNDRHSDGLSHEDEGTLSEEKFLTFDGTAIRYMLVNAIKEQQVLLDEKDDEIKELSKIVSKLTADMAAIKSQLEGLSNGATNESSSSQQVELSGNATIYLGQNTPNPFETETNIQYIIDVEFKDAKVVFYDASGRLIHQEPIKQRGTGVIAVTTKDMAPGKYSYSLVVDNVVHETKTMVLIN